MSTYLLSKEHTMLYWHIRNKIVGRIAIGIQEIAALDYLIRKYSHLPDEPEYTMVEVGTLFGGSLIAIDMLHTKYGLDKRTIVTIDPLEGYYDLTTDPPTGMIPSTEILYKNLERFGCNTDRIVSVKDSSYSEATDKLMHDYHVYAVFLDGDHSYEGVKADWGVYSNHVVPGGYILFHDYWTNNNWIPGDSEIISYGVRRFINEVVSKEKGWLHVTYPRHFNLYGVIKNND